MSQSDHQGSLTRARARVALPILVLSAVATFAACSDDSSTAPRIDAPPRARADIAPVSIDTFRLLGPSIPGMYSGTARVVLHSPAPAGGATVVVRSSNRLAWATPDSLIVVPEGTTVREFLVATGYTQSDINITLSATYLGYTRTTNFVVTKQPPSNIQIYPGTINFGRQAVGTVSDSQSVILENWGNWPLSLGAISVTGPFRLTHNNCPATLVHPGDWCKVWVSFAPTASAWGLQSGTLLIPNDSPNNPAAISLSGDGYYPTPGASVSPTSIGFGSLRLGLATSERTITLTSTGTGPLVVSSVNLGGNTYDFWLGDGCSGVSLQPGASCTVSVSFEPTHLGARTATVTFVHNAGGGSSVATLSGTGLKPGAYIP